MFIKLPRLGLLGKLLFMVITITVVSIVISTLITFTSMQNSIENIHFNKLKNIRTIKKNQIEDFFRERLNNINILSKSVAVQEGLSKLNSSFIYIGLNSSNYKKSKLKTIAPFWRTM